MDIILGTTNKGKVREVASILKPLGHRLVPVSKYIEETGETIEENALIKALAYGEDYPDMMVIAEDSGLVVPALKNLPGPYSSRFHCVGLDENLNIIEVGRDECTTDKTKIDIKNNRQLLELIKDVPKENRGAYLEVCFVVVKDKKVLFKTSQRSYGFITDAPMGTNGFGYDPIFIGNDTFGKTYAELDNARKNLRSHRRKALQRLALWVSGNGEKVDSLEASKIFRDMQRNHARVLVKEKLGVDFDGLTIADFRKLPLLTEGESKELRILSDGLGIIYFKPTIYSFTSNRTGVVPGSNTIRVSVSKMLCEYLKDNGIEHAYIDYSGDFVITKIVKNPNIEVIVKANHTGTSKHRYYGMHGSEVRESHPYFSGMRLEDMDSYPWPIVRFDWRNPFRHPVTEVQLADEVLCDEQADWFIDVKEAKKTALKAFAVLQDFLNTKDIMIYDLCLFISEDGKTVFGEISPDCGRFRHYDLGSLDKDVWRAGGSSKQVLDKWKLLHTMITQENNESDTIA